MNRVHKDNKDFLSVIITLGNNIRGGDTVFYKGVKTYDLGSRAHVLKHLHGRIIFVPFAKCFHEGTLWRGRMAVISFILTKQIFVYFYRHGDRFYSQYINKTIKTKYLDDDGSGVKPILFYKNRIRSSFCYDPIGQMWDRYQKITNHNFGGKRKSTGHIYLTGHNYCEAEVHLKMRS